MRECLPSLGTYPHCNLNQLTGGAWGVTIHTSTCLPRGPESLNGDEPAVIPTAQPATNTTSIASHNNQLTLFCFKLLIVGLKIGLKVNQLSVKTILNPTLNPTDSTDSTGIVLLQPSVPRFSMVIA